MNEYFDRRGVLVNEKGAVLGNEAATQTISVPIQFVKSVKPKETETVVEEEAVEQPEGGDDVVAEESAEESADGTADADAQIEGEPAEEKPVEKQRPAIPKSLEKYVSDDEIDVAAVAADLDQHMAAANYGYTLDARQKQNPKLRRAILEDMEAVGQLPEQGAAELKKFRDSDTPAKPAKTREEFAKEYNGLVAQGKHVEAMELYEEFKIKPQINEVKQSREADSLRAKKADETAAVETQKRAMNVEIEKLADIFPDLFTKTTADQRKKNADHVINFNEKEKEFNDRLFENLREFPNVHPERVVKMTLADLDRLGTTAPPKKPVNPGTKGGTGVAGKSSTQKPAPGTHMVKIRVVKN